MNTTDVSRPPSRSREKLKDFLRNLNFFPSVPPSTDEHELCNQQISTWLAIFLFTVSLVILLLYNSLKNITSFVIVEAPSFTQYTQLNSSYSQTLTCPCSNLSITYDHFLRIDYTLHQVCNSSFIEQTWINYLSAGDNMNFIKTDFRRTSQAIFRALNMSCALINTTIADSLIDVYAHQYVSASVVRQDIFESGTDALIQQFRSSMTNSFLLSLSMIRNTTQANALLSSLKSNYKPMLSSNRGSVRNERQIYGECSCTSSSTCTSPSHIYEYPTEKSLFQVPGFQVGCFVIEALLQSTLECLYDQTCIDHLQEYISSSSSVIAIALDSSLPSEYSTDVTIQELVKHLMIEKWNVSSVYEKYYKACHPIECNYNLQTRNDIVYIVTTLFGIAGGLTTVLQLIVPRLVKFLRRKNERHQPNSENLAPASTHQLFSKLKNDLTNFNIFPSTPPSTDEHELHNQRISTRLFFIIFTISLTTLLLYTALIKITKTGAIKKPTLAQFTELDSLYSQALTCPCSKISINYDKLLDIEYTLHKVCNSTFVSQDWINYLVRDNITVLYAIDFRTTAQSIFQALRTFCHLTDRTISDGLFRFYSDQYVSASVVREEVFEFEVKTLIDQFLSTMKSSFFLSLSMIRDTTQANALLSAQKTNYELLVRGDANYVEMKEIVLYGCYCASSSHCVIASGFFQHPDLTARFEIPGLYTGCFTIESLLQSTLQCFYDELCISELQKYFPSSLIMHITPLNSSLSNRYSIESPIQELVDNLMIEQWNASPIYLRYYNECQPRQCTYTFQTRNDLIYIVTTLFGIAGGLTTVLKIIVPRLIKVLRRKKNQQQRTTERNYAEQAAVIWQKVKDYLQNLNFFPSVPPSTNQNEIHTQRITTRLFIFLLITSMMILLLYTSLIRVTKIVHVNDPFFAKYIQLDSKYSQTLTCPCSNISINYKELFDINHTLHHVCRSTFTDPDWIRYLTTLYQVTLFTIDFRLTDRYTFQALKTFCDMFDRTISTSLHRFYDAEFISAFVLRQQIFESETEALIKQFRSSMINGSLLFLSMIRSTTQANALFSVLQNSYKLVVYPNNTDIGILAETYNNCSCASSAICINPAFVFYELNATNYFYVTDVYTGCSVIEALLQSTLECFHDQECIDQIQLDFSASSSRLIPAMTISSSSRYFTNSTIQELVNNLMIDEWNATSMYERYYNACHPVQCTYTFRSRNDAIYIVTTLFGITGGLVTVLEFVVPRFVDLIVRYIRRQRTAVAPVELIVET